MDNKIPMFDELIEEYVEINTKNCTPLERLYFELPLRNENNAKLLNFIYFMVTHPTLKR